MASAGLLILLMMSAFLFISSMTVSTPATRNHPNEISQEKLKKSKEALKAVCTFLLKNIDSIRYVVIPFLSIIPFGQPAINAAVTLTLVGVSVIDRTVNDKSILTDIKFEFEKLNSKLDQYQVEHKWNTWASKAYYEPEMNIEKAWSKYKTLIASLAEAKNYDVKKRQKEEFRKYYSEHLDDTETLHILLNKRGMTFINNLGDELAEHVKCHEKDIREYTVFIYKLIFKGNMMNEYYYHLAGTESQANVNRRAEIAYDTALAMFEIHKQCINNSMVYVIQDVKPRIDKSKKRDDLAQEVWSFLKDTYDRYDWMVVAFITKKSSHETRKFMNKHVLSGFTNVTTQGITVAIARQVKGTHTNAQAVSKVIQECVPEKELCYKVAETLSNCGKEVGKIPVKQTYTAVHAYIKKAHQSIDAKEANTEDEDEVSAAPENPSAQTPYIYTGKCEKSPSVKGGKFVVLIKSDEEMMEKDPCSKLDCGRDRGSCVPMKDMFLAVCQCNHPYYGQHCEKNIKDYGAVLEEEAGTHRNPPEFKDRRTRVQNKNTRSQTS